MNLIDGLKSMFSTKPISTEHDLVVREDGKILSDLRSVDDPTAKFAAVKYVRNVYQNTKPKRNVDYFLPEYDLPTIANAIQLDGILRRYVNIFKEQILKNGFEVTSPNTEKQIYIKNRLKEISYLTGVPFYQILTEVSEQLVSYANAYIIKVRELNTSKLGNKYRLYGRDNNPIVGLFVVDATTMSIGLNQNNNIMEYKQTIRGQELVWDERDVIHLTYNKIPGTLTGMPSIGPILDDVRALRKLEEEIEILGFQYSIPLYLYKVGNKDQPPLPGEIDDATARINNMPPYGMLVVPGNHTIEVPSNGGSPVNIIEFVNHFKNRIFSGLGISSVSMGESSTSNRNTSQVQDISMQSVTLSYQNIIKNKIELDLFRELSFDGGYDDTDEIELSFPEIDLENQIKFETNIIQKWQNNLISRDEARNEMDYEVDISDEDTFLKLVDIPKIMAQAEAKGMFAPAPATANKKAVDTKVRPANQHGKSTGRPKFKKDSIELISKRNDELINSLLTEDGYKSSINRSTYSKKLIELTRNQFHTQLEYNIRSICDYYHLMDRSVSNLDTSLFDVYFEDFSNIIESKLDSKFISKLDDRRISTICQSISSLILEQEDKLESLAQTIVYKSLGYRTILIDAKDCEKHVSTNLEINKIDFKSLPPFSYGCNCKIEEESFHEFNFKS